MFERFTDDARRVVVAAQEQARELQNREIRPEHLLLGMLTARSGVAFGALSAVGITEDRLRAAVQSRNTSEAVAGEHVPFSTAGKKVLEMSLREALALGHNHIGTEHLLLGLLREANTTVTDIFNEFGTDHDDIRREVLSLLGALSESTRDEPSPSDRFGRGGYQSTVLDSYGKNLTEEARRGRLDPVIGRESETQRVIQILARRTKNNPVLIGEPGVGKTAVVEGLAQAIASGSVPSILANKQVYTLDLASMVAGSRYRGDFEERVKKVISEATQRRDVMLFIDEIHTIVGAGASEGSMDASNILKPLLARGDLQVIGATTLDEYRKHVEKDAALERRFQPVTIVAPSVDATIEILRGLRDQYQRHHGVEYTDGALAAAARLSDRYIADRFLPDKAVDLLDEVGARAQVRRDVDNDELSVIDDNAVALLVSEITGVPVTQMTEEETKRLIAMESELERRVVGQRLAVQALSRSIRRTRAGLKDPRRPSGSFIFAGPSGVGKTELAKSLAVFLFGDENALISLDMSEFQEKHSVSRMFGAPPGYVGFEEGGQLTERVRRRPFSVVLFDEVEKAHPDVFNTLLQVLEEGRLTDSQGRSVDFRNTVVIMTTNLGTEEISKSVQLGFRGGSNESAYLALTNKVHDALKRHFRPEFLNRVDDTIVFPSLGEQEIVQIVDLLIAQLTQRLADRRIGLELTNDAKQLLARKGYDPVFGARPLRRTVQRLVEDALSERLLRGELPDGSIVVLDADNDELSFSVVPPVQDMEPVVTA